MENTFNTLVHFIRQQSGCAREEINEDTRFETDLGISGEDGEELIIAFAKTFNVDIRNFIFSKYFYPEPELYSRATPEKELAVKHLLQAISKGRLDDEVINLIS